jgi:hypothetical protein
MSLDKAINFLGENSNVRIRNFKGEIVIHLEEDVMIIYPEEKRAEFLDMDLVNETTLREKYYSKFPDLKSLFLKLVEERYAILP